MSFQEEWAGLVAGARARQSAGTQLNSAGGGAAGGGKNKLKVTPSVLRQRAGRAKNTVAKDFGPAQSGTASATLDVPGTMKGFACDEALKDYMDSWKKKVSYVKERLGSEGVAGALYSAADGFSGEDRHQGSNFDGGQHNGTSSGKPYKPGDVL